MVGAPQGKPWPLFRGEPRGLKPNLSLCDRHAQNEHLVLIYLSIRLFSPCSPCLWGEIFSYFRVMYFLFITHYTNLLTNLDDDGALFFLRVLAIVAQDDSRFLHEPDQDKIP